MSRPPASDQVAATTERLAVLVSAGLSPAAAWGHLARGASAGGAVAVAAEAAERGESVSAAVFAASAKPSGEPGAWRVVGLALELAERTGAPLQGVLETIAASLRDAAHADREIRAALTGPQLSTRLVLALPLVGVAFGYGLGFDPASVLLSGPVGWVLLLAGGGLFGLGVLWTRALVRRAAPPAGVIGLEGELVAVVVTSGLPVDTAVSLVRATAERHAVPLPASPTLDDDVALAVAAGAPVGRLLTAEARRARRDAAVAAKVRAESLAVTLLLPLGVCVLPAFMLLGVAPMLLSIVSSTVV